MKIVIGHKNPDTDSVVSSIAYAELKTKLGDKAFARIATEKVNKETEFVLNKFNVKVPDTLLDASGKEVILVDHNEQSQRVDGDYDIVEVVDHHQVNFSWPKPIPILVKPVGSTSTIIANLFKQNNVRLSAKTAGILLGGIVSDTVIFKSPITTKLDRETADLLARKVNVNPEKFGIEMFNAKSEWGGKSSAEIILSDYKEYDFGKKRVGIAQVETVDATPLIKRKDEFLAEMADLKSKKGLYFIGVMLTNIITMDCLFLVICDDETVIKKAFNKELRNNEVHLKGVLSRKKQVVPKLYEIIK